MVRQACKDSVFEKWRGIGTPGIVEGSAAVLRWTREMRGDQKIYRTFFLNLQVIGV